MNLASTSPDKQHGNLLDIVIFTLQSGRRHGRSATRKQPKHTLIFVQHATVRLWLATGRANLSAAVKKVHFAGVFYQ